MTTTAPEFFRWIAELQNPAYLHAVINHFPIIGSIFGAFALAVALLMRNRSALLPGLLITTIAGIAAWPTYLTGSSAYKPIRKIADDSGIDWLDLHMDHADEATWVFYVMAGFALLALLALLTLSKWPKLATALSAMALIAALVSTIAGIYIARPGGCVRHPEFRPQAVEVLPNP